MIDFLIKSTISLTVCLGFYHLVLEREKIHQFNRFYLLFTLIISFAIPFLSFEIIKIIPVVQNIESINIETISSPIKENTLQEYVVPLQETINYIPYIIWSLYGLVTLLVVTRFGKNYWKLILKSKSNPIVKYKNANLVLLDEKTLPHSFLNFIFINFDDHNNRTIEDELYTHELVHVTQKHTLDILFIELLNCIFWFNPLIYFYKIAIQLNHEFLADEEIVRTYNNVPFYQNLLLQKSNNVQTIYLASNLNYSVTKKRLIMMTKSTSQKIAIIKKIAIVPILAALIYFFCVEIVAQEKVVNLSSEIKNSQMTDKDKIRDSYYSGVYVNIFDEKSNRKSVTVYEELSLEDKRKYLDYIPEIQIEKEISELLFKKLKNGKWKIGINNKQINKEELKNYKRTDFIYYSYNIVDKSERTEKFPLEYQYTLYTKDYFYKNMKDSNIHFKGDSIKIGNVSYETAMKNKIARLRKADTLVWYTEGKEGYNLYVNNSINKTNTSKNKQEKNSPKTIKEADYFQGVRFIYKEGGKDGIVIIDKVYEKLTEEDKEKFAMFLKIGIPKPFQKLSPTQKELDDFKNSKKYAIWIDGKNVPNENLSKYKPNEIAHFSGSVILKNARSKKFPQPFQYWFSTHKYFDETKMGVQKTKYLGDKVEVVCRKK